MLPPSGSAVSDEQAGGLGGADKQTGAHGENTHQKSDERQIVLIARYKPAPSVFEADPMAAADGMIGSVTGAVQGAVNAVESAMASIPGLQMFIKEDKQDSPSEKEYKYEYAEWTQIQPKLDSKLKKLFSENSVPKIFDFDATDVDGRIAAAKKLYDGNLKTALSNWSGYKVKIHLVGIGQGGNVMNELTDLLSKDAQFKSERWLVKSLFYIGTPVYSVIHQPNKGCMKSEGNMLHFNSHLDFTQQILAYCSPSDDLLAFIINSNSNTLSLAVGKIKLTIVKILSLFLGNSSFGSDNPEGLNKFKQIQPEIEKLVTQFTDMIKQIASEIASFADLSDLPKFSEVLNGFDQVPARSIASFHKFISDVGDTLKSQAKKTVSGGGQLGPQNLMGVFNCLCPLLDQITKALSVFDPQSPASKALANKIIENAGIKEIYGKGKPTGSNIELNKVAEDYLKDRMKIYEEQGKLDKNNKLIQDASKVFLDIKGNKVDVAALPDDKKIALAGALYSMVEPMMVSKKRVLEELQKWIAKLNIEAAIKDISANKLFGFAGNFFEGALSLKFERPLNDSINNVDAQLDKLKSFFKKREYGLHKDTLFFTCNIHNQVINNFFDVVHYRLDQQTGYLDYMENRGAKNQFSETGKNTYKPDAEKNAADIMPTNKLPESKAA